MLLPGLTVNLSNLPCLQRGVKTHPEPVDEALLVTSVPFPQSALLLRYLAVNVTLTVGSGVPFYYNSGHAAFYRYFNISARPGAPSILRVGRAAVPVAA